MNVVDKLVIALGLDASGVQKGVAQAQGQIAGLGGFVSKIFAPLLAGMSFKAIFDSINNELKQMSKMSKATQTSIEDITAWSRAVEESGGSVDGFEQTLITLNNGLTKISVTGNDKMKPFFEKLGLDATELAKKPVLDSLDSISKAVEGMDKRESANILKTMGFDNGTIKLLQSGEKGMKELIARQKELGVYTEKDAKALAAMNKGFREITSAIKTLFIPVVMLIMTTASKVVTYLTNGVLLLRKNMDLLRGVVLLLAAAFSKQLLRSIIMLGKALMANPFGLFIMGLAAILLLLEDLWVYAKGGKSAFADIWKNFGSPEEVMKGFKAVGNAISGVLKAVGNLFSGQGLGKTTKFLMILVGGIAALIAAIGWIPVAIAAAVALLVAYWDKIYQKFEETKEWFASVGSAITGIFDAVGSAITNALTSAANAAKSAWAGFIAWLEEKWNWIKGLLPSLSSIASKLPGFGNAVSMASHGGGGGTTNSSVTNDNRNIVVNNHTPEASRAFARESGLVPQANGATT